MAKQTINTLKSTHHAHGVMIGTPLVLILAFSFGFVLLHPNTDGQTAAASRPIPNTHDTPGVKASNLTPLPIAPSTLPTLDPATQTGDSGSQDAATDTSNPQATSGSGAPTGSPSVQSAAPNTLSNPNASLKIKTKSASSGNVLTNLLHGLGL